MGAGLAVGAWMLALSSYDLRQRRLPNWLTLPGAGVILLAASLTGRGLDAAIGAVALGAIYLAVYLINPKSMGGGDVKLALGLGALTGAFGTDVWALAAFGAPLLTAAYAVVALLLWHGRTVPHGPSMCLSSASAVALAVG
ncbi:leader peptidase (prepilin peptidase)/N-methyltransferase [Mycobacterium sp. MAA66]|uniref:prepilin peptidase n=1 Tax=Mycobacterium sp. MAA66 TaxID=3156297 RepID=UPI00351845C2